MSENSLDAYVKQGLVEIQPDQSVKWTPVVHPRYMIDADHNVIITYDSMEWAKWFEDQQPGVRRVAYDNLDSGWEISTVFLALDHAFGGGEPVLFETMVFGPEEQTAAMDEDGYEVGDQYTVRYRTYEEAEAGHQKLVKLLSNVIDGYAEVKAIRELVALLEERNDVQ